jgi:hypothetical protein
MVCEADTVRHVWHAVEFFGNTILFQLAGAIFYESTHKSVYFEDWGWLIVLYILATLARGFMIVVFCPYLNAVAPCKAAKISWKECVVMTWGGLRGAVGLALALTMRTQLYEDGKPETGDKMVFFVGGFAALTLLINATTCSLVLAKLGITKPPEAREKLVNRLQLELLEMAIEECNHLVSNDMRFASCSVSAVEGILQRQVHKSHHNAQHAVMSMFATFRAKGHVHLQESETNVIGSSRVPAPEVRIDPESGEAHTFAELRVIKQKCTEQELEEFWNSCSPALPAVWEESDVAPVADEMAAKVAIAKEGRPAPRFSKHSTVMDEKPALQAQDEKDGEKHWWWGFDPIDAGAGTMLAQKTREFDEVSKNDLEAERHYYLSMLGAQYQAQLRENLIPSNASGAFHLPSSVDRAADFAHERLMDWAVLKTSIMRKPNNIRKMLKVIGLTFYSDVAPIRMRDEHVFDLFSVVVFLDAHHLVCARLAGDKKLRSTARGLIVEEVGKVVEEVHGFLKENKIGPSQIGAVRTRQLLAVLFAKQEHQVHAWLQKGIVNDGEAEELMHHVHDSLKAAKTVGLHTAGEGSPVTLTPKWKASSDSIDGTSSLSPLRACRADSRTPPAQGNKTPSTTASTPLPTLRTQKGCAMTNAAESTLRATEKVEG